MDDLACAHCGAQMHVERGGGTVSLELVEAIRTGTAQTAAELALVRLEKEWVSASCTVQDLERTGQAMAQDIAQSRESFRKQDLMSDQKVASATDRAAALRSEKFPRWPYGIVMILIPVGVLYGISYKVSRAHSNDGSAEFLALIGWGILGVALGGAAWIGTGFLMVTFEDSHDKRVETELKELDAQMGRHLFAVSLQQKLLLLQENLGAAKSEERLHRARAELARIDEEIARNRDIVRLR